MKTIEQIDAIVREFDPNDPLIIKHGQGFRAGIKFAVNAFKKATCPADYAESMKQIPGESDKDYQSRLRNEIVELMCSNRGYASCFEMANK
jgi:hypothetical protein